MVLNIPSSGEGILVVQSNPETCVRITVNVSLNMDSREEHDTWKEIRSFPSGEKQILHPMVASVTVTLAVVYTTCLKIPQLSRVKTKSREAYKTERANCKTTWKTSAFCLLTLLSSILLPLSSLSCLVSGICPTNKQEIQCRKELH